MEGRVTKGDFKMCSFAWNDCEGKLGSNHACGLERGHAGVHECLTCNATEENPSPLETTIKKETARGGS